MDVDGAVKDLVVAFADFFEECFAGFNATDGAAQGKEEVEFDGGEGEG